MKNCIKLIFILLCIYSCNSGAQNKVVSVKEFTKKYSDVLRAKTPHAKFTMIDDTTIISELKELSIRISAYNAYQEYKSEPDSLQQILNRYAASAGEAFAPEKKLSIENIVPVIKPFEYLDEIKTTSSKLEPIKSFDAVYEKYNDQLIFFMQKILKNNISYLTEYKLINEGIKKDSLKEIAIKNLERILTNIQRNGGNGIYMVTAGGNYEASIILLTKVLNKENFSVKGDLVIAIPSRDLLLVTGSNDKEGIQKIKKLTTETFKTGQYILSEYLYKWNGHSFEKFE